MNRLVFILASIAACLLWLRPLPLAAAENTQWGLSTAVELLHFHYRETDTSGEELNREDGILPGLDLRLRAERGRWFARFGGSIHGGSVDYDGQTQGGTPVTTRTRTGLYSLSLRTGRWLGDGAHRWGPFFRLAHQWWDRDIRSTSNAQGIFETYQWNEAGAGLRYRWREASRQRWGHEVSAEMFRTFDTEVLVRLSSLQGSNLDDITLHPTAAMGGRLLYSASLERSDGTRWFIEPWVALWEFGRSPTREATSNGSPSGTLVTEPESESRRIGIRLRLAY